MKRKNVPFNSFLISHYSEYKEQYKDELENSVFHYTSPEAFLSIIKNQQIRFTDAEYMNDKLEGKYIVKSLIEFVEKHKNEYPHFSEAVENIFKTFDRNDVKELRINKLNYSELTKHNFTNQRHFIFCASTASDSLSMWNYYVHNDKYFGYNIGFKQLELLKTFDTDSIRHADHFLVKYGKVLYTPKQQNEEISNLAKQTENQYEYTQDLDFITTNLILYIMDNGFFFKSPKFKDENEFRIMISIGDELIPNTKNEATKYFGENNRKLFEDVCIKNGIITPFINIALPDDCISSITVSPITEFELAKQGIKELFKISNIPTRIQVRQSQIPIRY